MPDLKVLTWMATNRDPRFLENAVYAMEKKCKGKVSTVYYLYGGYSKDSEIVAQKLQETESFFSEKLSIVPIQVGSLDVNNPTKIYDSLIKVLSPLLSKMGDICINISSGTPMMSTIWMVLNAMDFFKGRAKFYSVQKGDPTIHKSDDVCEKEKQKIELIDFKLKNTYLELVRDKQKITAEENPLTVAESNSPKRNEACEKIKCYARVEGVPLFLLGERGVGKSNAVKTLISSIKGKKLVELACGSLDSSLAEAKIFGHKKGAYTGADTEEKGLLEEANGNILFLDEIQDLPKTVQRKLLQTIQEKDHPYRQLGSAEIKSANIQFVFASNFKMEDLRERLDPDFYDRISFYTVNIPSLRECKEDIKTDWQKIWDSCTDYSGKKSKPKDESAVPPTAPWNDDLAAYFNQDENLQGNWRSLQIVAFQIIAWKAWDNPEKIKEILEALEIENRQKIEADKRIEAKRNGISIEKEFSVEDFKEFQNLSWKDAEVHFKRALANWAHLKYRTWEKAAEKLDCSKPTLLSFQEE